MKSRWILDQWTRPFINMSGEEIPQFACMLVTGAADEGNNDSALEVDKPTDEVLDYGRYAFNVGQVVEDGKRGVCQLWFPALAAIDGDIELSALVGPVEDSWYLGKTSNGPFFRATAPDPIGAYELDSVKTWFIGPDITTMVIEYKIITAGRAISGPFKGLMVATAVVHVGPLALLGVTVNVYDHSDNLFDDGTMEGYTGWASWGQSWSLEDGADCETPAPLHWFAINRVCDPDTGIYAEPC